MKHLPNLFLFTIILLLNSCSPKISTNIGKKYPALDYKQDVLVIELNCNPKANLGNRYFHFVQEKPCGLVNFGYDMFLVREFYFFDCH